MAPGTRILVLTNLFPHRPGEKQGNFVLDQVRALVSQGAEVTVVVARPWNPLPFFSPKHKQPINEGFYTGEKFKLCNASFFSLPRFALGEKAYDFARQGVLPALTICGNCDVIHAHGLLMGYVANAFARATNRRFVLTLHGIETHPLFDDTDAKRAKIRDVLEQADRVMLVGSPLLEYCGKYTRKTDHLAVVGNGFTTYPDLKPSQRICRSKQVRVVAVSNYEESKGFDLLVQAIVDSDLKEKIELVMVGGGHGFAKLQRHVRELGLQSSIHFTGAMPHRDTLAEVLAADIFCLPSWREAYGIMYAEAMALGKFTIGCKGQGPSDFIRHLETGYLVEPGNTDAVSSALHWAMEDPAQVAEIARRGQDFANRNLTWDANASKLLEIYRETARARHAESRAQHRTAPA